MGRPGINQRVDPLEFTNGRIADLNPLMKCSHSLIYFSTFRLAVEPSNTSIAIIHRKRLTVKLVRDSIFCPLLKYYHSHAAFREEPVPAALHVPWSWRSDPGRSKPRLG